MDDLTIQRLRVAGLSVPSRAEPSFGALRAFQVYNAGSMPSTTPRVYACRPIELAGTEVEGGTWNSVATAVFVPVVFLGPDAPALGEIHDAVQYGGRWISTFNKRASGSSGGTGTLFGCVCQHPKDTLYMTVATCTDGRFHDCTIQYGPTPSGLGALQLGANCYLSTTSFPDPQTGDLFYYYLSCFSGIVRISRVFPTSIYGSPFLDSTIYFWAFGFPGNTCSPFYLSNGSVFAGGDPNCLVIIQE